MDVDILINVLSVEATSVLERDSFHYKKTIENLSYIVSEHD